MSRKPFESSRANGLSDTDILVALVADAQPGTLFAYPALREALEADTARVFTQPKISAAVRNANPRLLAKHQRVFQNIKNEGYRIAPAAAHLAIAGDKERKAGRLIRRGIDILTGTRVDELTPVERSLRDGHLLIASGLYQAVKAVALRQARAEQAISSLFERVGQLEGRAG